MNPEQDKYKVKHIQRRHAETAGSKDDEQTLKENKTKQKDNRYSSFLFNRNIYIEREREQKKK